MPWCLVNYSFNLKKINVYFYRYLEAGSHVKGFSQEHGQTLLKEKIGGEPIRLYAIFTDDYIVAHSLSSKKNTNKKAMPETSQKGKYYL